jgi:hypothetical protein
MVNIQHQCFGGIFRTYSQKDNQWTLERYQKYENHPWEDVAKFWVSNGMRSKKFVINPLYSRLHNTNQVVVICHASCLASAGHI